MTPFSEITTTTAEDASSAPIEGVYQGYLASTAPERALEMFVARYGYEPDRILAVPNVLLMGPVHGRRARTLWGSRP